MTEAEQLSMTRERLRALGACQWVVVRDTAGRFLETRLRSGQFLRIADFDPGADEAEVTFIEHAPATVRLLVDLVDRCAARVRALTEEVARLKAEIAGLRDELAARGEAKDYAAEAAIKGADPAFRRFLAERHGLTQDREDMAAACLKAALGITSRKQLNTDPAVAARWRAMVRDFAAWAKGGRS